MSKKRKTSSGGARPPTQTRYILDSFSENDLERFESRSSESQDYNDRVYFDLERQRAQHHKALCAALQSIPPIIVPVDSWGRVTDWRWSSSPLSPIGSIKLTGGRFNIGQQPDRARGQHFPAIYAASTYATAMSEYLQYSATNTGRLSIFDLALRNEKSFTTFALRGHIDRALDLRTHSHLQPFVDIISKFTLNKDTVRRGRLHKIPPRALVKSTSILFNLLFASPNRWRTDVILYGIPAPSQIFGRFVRDAGFEAVLYRSQQGTDDCVAIFPENFANSSSVIRIASAPPDGATCFALDKDNLCLDGVSLSYRR